MDKKDIDIFAKFRNVFAGFGALCLVPVLWNAVFGLWSWVPYAILGFFGVSFLVVALVFAFMYGTTYKGN